MNEILYSPFRAMDVRHPHDAFAQAIALTSCVGLCHFHFHFLSFPVLAFVVFLTV